MALAFSTLVVFVLLVPGLLAVAGLYKSDNLTRELVPTGTLSQLSVLVLASVLIHFAMVCFIDGVASPRLGFPSVNLQYVLSLASLGSPNSVTYPELAENLRTYSGWIATYFIVSKLLGFGLGYLVGKLILKGPLRFFATHAWLYDVFGQDHRKQKRVVFAYVLSNVENDGSRIIYCGDVKKCMYQSDGTLSYIVLAAPRRGMMKLGDTITTCGSDGSDSWQVMELTSRTESAATKPGTNLLYIKSDNIVNVFFASQPWSYARKNVQDLEKIVKNFQEAMKRFPVFNAPPPGALKNARRKKPAEKQPSAPPITPATPPPPESKGGPEG